MTIKISIPCVALAGALLAGAASAQGMASAIKIRQHAMQAIFAATSDIKKAIASGADLIAVAPRAQEIADHTKKLPVLFPPQSSPASGLKSGSRETIWEHQADFNAIAGRLVHHAEGLAAALRKNDKAEVAAEFAATTDQCGACHRRYRARQ